MEKSVCRVSGDALSSLVNFGNMPLGNGFLLPKDFDREYFYKMAVGFSEKSKMFQLIDQPTPEKMFHEEYAFYSSTSIRMAEHFKEFANSIIASEYLQSKDPFVVELGCNDGIMLKNFADKKIKHLGVEPSKNVAKAANEKGVRTCSEFFSAELAHKIVEEDGKADAFLAANVMCHIPNIVDVVEGINILLNDKGIIAFEDPYLGDVIEKVSYDQIYDEHVFLFSAISINNLFSQFDFELIDVIHQPTHGGSMRYVLAKKGVFKIKESVIKLLEKENLQGLDKIETVLKFKENVEHSKGELVTLLKKLKAQHKRIAGYGATSKSTTILNYCDIGPDLIEYISDTTPIKQGKLTPGVHIPVVPYETFKENPPDYAILFAWNHAEEIMAKEKDFMAKGGKWITHVPNVRIL